jgi:hypothetical protein
MKIQIDPRKSRVEKILVTFCPKVFRLIRENTVYSSLILSEVIMYRQLIKDLRLTFLLFDCLQDFFLCGVY